MKKVILIALLFIALKAHSQGGSYTLANKPINLGWADNSGVTYIRGQLYIRSLTTGLSTDSVLVVLNGQVRKVKISDIATLSSITGLQDSLTNKPSRSELGSAAYLDASTGHTSAGTVALRDESGKTGLEDLYLGSGYNDWLSTILTGKASTSSLDNYLLKTGGTLSGSVTIDKSLDGEVSHNIINSNTGGGAYSFSQLTNGTSSFQMFHFGTNFTTSGNFIQNGSLLNANGVGGLTIATPNGTTKIVSSTVLTSFPSITAATAGRVLFSTTAGQLTDDADLTFDGSNLITSGIGVGTTTPNAPQHIVYPFAKTDVTARTVAQWSSNEANGSQFKLNLFATGGATSSSRKYMLQTSNEGVANDGVLSLQGIGGSVEVPDGTASTHAVNKGQLDLKANSANPTFTDRTTVQSFATGILTTTTDGYNFTSSGHTVLVNASGGNKTINIPSATINTGRIIIVKKIDSSGNTVTLSAFGTELIDGASGKVLSTQYAGYQLQSDGAAWYIIATF